MSVLCIIICLVSQAYGGSWVSDYSGLASYVSRPDLRPQTLNITTHDSEALAPGYWFTAPYYHLKKPEGTNEFRPGQVGPHIFDRHGELVWSGSVKREHENAFDFRVAQYRGSPHLTFISEVRRRNGQVWLGNEGIIMDGSYKVIKRVRANNGQDLFNLHEFNVLPDGRHALLITVGQRPGNTSSLNSEWTGIVKDDGFEEVDLVADRTVFRWSSVDHIPITDSYWKDEKNAFDYLHINAVDKTMNGDYLVSCRYASAIYRVSGRDGSIIWILGGKRSDFGLKNFKFAYQHHVRILQEDDTHMVLSLFNNAAAGDYDEIDSVSSALVISLNLVDRTAESLHTLKRPDGDLTRLRGSVQVMSSGNYFVGWSMYGYTSEFAPDGHLIQETIYSSERMSDYRTYKYEWQGHPTYPPSLKALSYATHGVAATIKHVSWNGATEVAAWNFYAANSPVANVDGSFLLGNKARTGFETIFVSKGYHRYTFAEAVSANGTSLGISAVEETVIPTGEDYHQLEGGDETSESFLEWPHRLTVVILLGILVSVTCVSLFHLGRFLRYRLYWKRQGKPYIPLSQDTDM